MKLLALALLLSSFSSLTLTEVVGSFQRCFPFFIRNPSKENKRIVPTVFKGDQYKMICQRWKNVYRFATVYDTEKRIPVYSAYTFTGGVQKRPDDVWKIEPQLDDIKDDWNGKLIKDKKEMIDSPNSSMATKRNITHQAVDSDYREASLYTRGHLFPSGFAADQRQTESTFTLTNIAPQTTKENNEWDNKVETPMRKTITNICRLDNNNPAYIVTGVVPGNKWISIKRDKKYSDGINIPSHYWSAFICTSNQNNNQLLSNAYIFEQQVNETTTTTVKDLNNRLTGLYNQTFKVFGELP